MKLLILSLLISAFVYSSCNDSNKESKSTSKDSVSATSESVSTGADQKTGTVDDLLLSYLSIKNALANDNAKEAANAAKQITASVESFNVGGLNPDQSKVYNEIGGGIKEHADHIEDNSNNIVHQREHFEFLSQDMIDLVKSIGSKQTLYRDFCPMYNNKKGASWLSEKKEIKNPYYGKEMLTCGEIKEEIKGK